MDEQINRMFDEAVKVAQRNGMTEMLCAIAKDAELPLDTRLDLCLRLNDRFALGLKGLELAA